MINSVSLTIIFASSIIVADGGTVISIPQAINLMNAPTFAITQTIIHRTSPVIFMRQTAISLPHMINDGTATIISGSQIIIFEAEIIISVTEMIISGTRQVPANEWVPDSPHANTYRCTEEARPTHCEFQCQMLDVQ